MWLVHSLRFWFSSYTEIETFTLDQLPELLVKAAECSLALLKDRGRCWRAACSDSETVWIEASPDRVQNHSTWMRQAGQTQKPWPKSTRSWTGPWWWGRAMIKPGVRVSKSGLSMAAISRVRHRPMITRKVHSDQVCPRSSQEVSPEIRINRDRSQVEPQSWQCWRQIHLNQRLKVLIRA